VNEAINASSVRVVGAEGEMLGVMTIDQARDQADNIGLDLVEISPNADPPVCKIFDYGKYKYQAQKKANEARKKQKVVEVKEIKMRPGIDQHDYDVKMRAINKFLDEGDKVKVTIRFRGREFLHQELGLAVLNRVRQEVDEKAKVEAFPKMEGRQMIMVVAPHR
jgi:translation initiation factor IF-3